MHPGFAAFLAQTAPPTQTSPFGSLTGLLPLLAIFVLFWFLFIRPQSRQQKEHANFVASLKKGDEVVTQGGIIGTVTLVEDRTVTVDVGGGTKLRILKAQVAGQWKPVEAQPAKAEAKK